MLLIPACQRASLPASSSSHRCLQQEALWEEDGLCVPASPVASKTLIQHQPSGV